MNLRIKTAIIVTGAITLGCLALAGFGQLVMMEGFKRLENREAQFNAERVRRVVESELTFLEAKAGDWAQWDDALSFVNGQNADFISSNMTESLCSTLKVSMVLYVKKTGQILTGKSYDVVQKSNVDLSPGLSKILYEGSPLLSMKGLEDKVSGLARLPEGVLLYTALPVTDSGRKVGSDAVVFLATWLDEGVTKRFGETVQLDLSLESYPLGKSPSEGSVAASFTPETNSKIEILNDTYLKAYNLFVDEAGSPAALLTAKIDRAIMAQGRESIRGFITALAGGGILFAIFLGVLLEKGIVARVRQLSSGVVAIGENGDLGARVEAKGSDEISTLSRSINGMLTIIEEKTLQMRTIFANINQGIAMLDGQGQVRGDSSAAFSKITGVGRTEGRTVDDLVLARSTLNGDNRSQVNTFLMAAVGEDILSFEINKHCLPRELSYEVSGSKRHFELDWQPIMSATDTVEKVMLTLRDVTELRALKEASQKSLEEVERIMQILHVPAAKLTSFFDSTQSYLEEIKNIIAKAHTPSDLTESNRTEVRRNLHTIKGNSRTLGLSHLTVAVHAVEDAVFPLLPQPITDEGKLAHLREVLDLGLRSIGSEIDQYLGAANRLVGKVDDGGASPLSSIKVDEAVGRVVHFLDRASFAIRQSPEQANLQREAQQVKYAALNLTHESIADQVLTWQNLAKSIAAEVNCQTPDIEYSGSHDVVLSKDANQAVADTMVHLIRNAVDHGLRQLSANGKIKISVDFQTNKGLSLMIEDNGSGINLAKLKAKAQGQKMDLSTPEAVANLIFLDGISTKDTVTQLSGRGAGMAAARTFIENLGGSCILADARTQNAQGNVPARFLITLPLSAVLAYAEVSGPTNSAYLAA